ncbi:MAG: hypothetical protein P8Y70_19135 [Candidatus Lokiarchaeota archaeon]
MAHHTQCKGHPFKKIVVRTPGPSSVATLWILNINPFVFDSTIIKHQFLKLF